MSNEVSHRLKIARTDDGVGINLWSNDRTLYFSNEMWLEFLRMALHMERNNLSTMANFTEPEPIRTPTLPKSTIEDLV